MSDDYWKIGHKYLTIYVLMVIIIFYILCFKIMGTDFLVKPLTYNRGFLYFTSLLFLSVLLSSSFFSPRLQEFQPHVSYHFNANCLWNIVYYIKLLGQSNAGLMKNSCCHIPLNKQSMPKILWQQNCNKYAVV